AVLGWAGPGDIAPDWGIGLLCGVGGLVGGYVGAHLQPRLPERGLRLVLGGLAVAVAILYAGQVALGR
ncbi:sulfite exporter TauE/SafE family protein, partial [Actinoplanes sp. NPDC048791]